MLNALINAGQLGTPGRNTARRTVLTLTGLSDAGANRASIDVLTGVVRSRLFELSTLNPTGTGAVVANGLEMQSATQMYLNQGGNVALKITAGRLRINSASGMVMGPSGNETNLVGSLNILEQYHTSAQSFRVYNTYTSATNHERGVFDWITTANTLRIGTEKGSGGGTARDLVLVTDGTTRLTIGATTGNVTLTAPITLKGYTVATLPAGVQGHKAFVTDALVPTYNAALTGGGAVIVPVFYNGTAWVSV